jgi:hypothetical protein
MYLVEFLPNREERPRILCPINSEVFLDESYIPKKRDCWIKITNENDEPLELTIEFIHP